MSVQKSHIRYFHVTVYESISKFTICEYFGDFGRYSCDNATNRFNSVHNGQIWLIFSDLPMVKTQAQFIESKLLSGGEKWKNVDLKSIQSLPEKLRKNTKDFTRGKR